jgi:cytoskeletal protein CcmA (bactofilin family)
MGIFGKSPEQPPATAASLNKLTPPPPGPTAAPSAASAGASVPKIATGPCIVGAKTTIKGEISGDEDVLVEGVVEGQIHITKDLRVGPGGVVKAKVQAQSVVVSGQLLGDCQATHRVEIQATGKLMGNIRAPRVVIAEGASFKGNSDMTGRGEEK